MSHPNPRPPSSGSERTIRSLIAALCVLAAAGAAGADPAPPDAPGLPPIGVKRFQLPPGDAAVPWRLLVIPVRFPEDRILEGGDRDTMLARLNGESIGALRGYWRAATRGRLLVEATAGPTVVAPHARTYYTVEGEGNLGWGLDPGAYPHNARRLVEDVTAALADRVDFRRFDNTGDGLADGLLLLHSGPAAPEGDFTADPSTLLAHAFTLEAPAARGDGRVFAYAVAATADPIGPWAHETGHLLGLPDLYVANPFFPGDGVGDWSLMATGANAGGGTTPAGLDAASRVLLGVETAGFSAAPVDLAGGAILRVFRPGDPLVPESFLVERRDGSDGLWTPDVATVVYRYDEAAGDNRNPLRPLVEVRAVVCRGGGACGAVLDDATAPSLRDGADEATSLRLAFSSDGVAVRGTDPRRAVLAACAAGDLRPEPGGGTARPLALTLTSFESSGPLAVTVSVEAGSGICIRRDGGATASLVVAPGGTIVDTTFRAVPCDGATFPAAPVPLTVRVATGDTGATGVWPTALVPGTPGLAPDRFGPVDYVAVNLAPGRVNPWNYDTAAGAWVAAPFGAFADAALESPWFTVPDGARLAVDHAWTLDAPAPESALDAVRVVLARADGTEIALQPELGWGWEAERGTGNALAGLDVLSGSGDRVHVLDLSPWAGETARVRFEAAGDVAGGTGAWTIRSVAVLPAPAERYTLEIADGWARVRSVGATAVSTGVFLYGDAVGTTASRLLAAGTGGSRPASADVPPPGASARFAVVWVTADGSADGIETAWTTPPRDARALLVPFPNPSRAGGGQTWSVEVPEGAGGMHGFLLIGADGGLVAEREAFWDAPGRRAVAWDGRDRGGRPAAAGVYLLVCRFPDGRAVTRKVVVLP